MDPFTEKILARARERQKMLSAYMGDKTHLRENNDLKTNSEPNLTEVKLIRKEALSEPDIRGRLDNNSNTSKENSLEGNSPKIARQNSKTRVSSEFSGSPKTKLKTNIQKDNFNMEIKLSSSDNVRLEVEIEEQVDSDTESCTSESGLRDESKNKLKRLGKLYAGGDEVDISSPIHRTEAKFCSNEESENKVDKKRKDVVENMSRSRKGLGGLANLAQTINQWEEDSCLGLSAQKKPATPRKAWKPPAPQPPDNAPTRSSPPKPSQKPKAPDPPVIKNDNPKHTNSELKEHASPIVQGSPKSNNETSAGKGHHKQLKWDKKVLDTLAIYSYHSQDDHTNTKSKTTQIDKSSTELRPHPITEEEDCPKENGIRAAARFEEKNNPCPRSKQNVGLKSPSKSNIRATSIANKASLFESSPTKNTKDPALLSVSERKALFEKNRGDALIPKAPFGMPIPPSSILNKQKDGDKSNAVLKKTIKNDNAIPKPVENVKTIVQTPSKMGKQLSSAPRNVADCTSSTVAAVQQAGGIASKVAALLESKSTISQEQIESKVKEQRQKEMDMLLNRFNRNKEVVRDVIEEVDEDSDDEVDATEQTAMITDKSAKIVGKAAEKRKSGDKSLGKGDSPIVTSILDDIKRIKVSPPKAGRLYPNLSDIEAVTTETDTRTPSPDDDNSSYEENYYDSDDPNTSFGREILQAVCKNQTPQKRPILDESTASDVSSILDDMDNYLDELSNEENGSVGPTPPKQVRQASPQKASTQPSNSFNYRNYSPNVSNSSKSKFQSPVRIRTSPTKCMDLPTYVVEGDNVLPLTHTVSFYRKQQNEAHTPLTPVRQITRQPLIEEHSSEDPEERKMVQKKVDELQEEVNKQQNIISQTSQALNLCNNTLEFSGSTEQVEAERVLLVATHRRQAALHELQRLKVEGTLRPQGQHAQNLPLEKGTLTISNIVLPLKQKYVKALAAAGGKGHHVVCLNPDTDLYIPGNVTLNNVYSDFTVTFEVYCLQAQEEFLPHEVKYHINNKKSANKLTTPKKSKQESRMIMPIRESPAGPQAVRTSSFAVMGYVVFSVQAVNKRTWSLNNTPSMSPLDGSVQMRINCDLAVSVEQRGFLTMFEDVSGFGAWHRRWCLLKGHTLSFWKYPDDEKKMAPIDSIDLKNCITKQVGPVSRDICARLHTFLIERERPAYPKDKDSLVTVCKGNKTIIRHLLSADTKEERIEWCNKFNAALTALRMWGNSSNN
ncbi:hypothetical protein NQ317_001128 [Molorchus minor]|uniref:PH domain-containing protein n=1 Tax=Molorchus minor TaxID=1323400 RepID=A0ABQ9J8A8_9CUCU|nr:hypothetical protein NQ317_001128 [Molorchus minor]